MAKKGGMLKTHEFSTEESIRCGYEMKFVKTIMDV